MCHALLRVRYRGNDAQLSTVETAEDLERRLEDLRGNEQVIAISVYAIVSRLERTTVWTDTTQKEETP